MEDWKKYEYLKEYLNDYGDYGYTVQYKRRWGERPCFGWLK